jgi:hypothetical protein
MNFWCIILLSLLSHMGPTLAFDCSAIQDTYNQKECCGNPQSETCLIGAEPCPFDVVSLNDMKGKLETIRDFLSDIHATYPSQ